jgi:hypothetical protein
VVPPLVQVLGAVVCGPNTLNVIVPVAPLAAPVSVALIAVVAIAVPVAFVDGADTVVVVSVTEFVKAVVAVQDVL